jgi:hypothetical protein
MRVLGRLRDGGLRSRGPCGGDIEISAASLAALKLEGIRSREI